MNLSAKRILQGEMPHRDFNELYTGLLSYVHAGTHTVLGSSMKSLRVLLAVSSLGALSVLYFLFLHFVSAPLAVIFSLAALVWGPSFYFAPLPSWYFSFCCIFSVFFMFRYMESSEKKYLFYSGLICGISCLIKISGLFALAAHLLFLALDPQGRSPSSKTYRTAFVLFGLALFSALVFILLKPHLHFYSFLHFLLPTTLTVFLIMYRELKAPPSKLKPLLLQVACLLSGFLVPVLGFGAYFYTHGALKSLVYGVFIIPMSRLSGAAFFPEADILGTLCLVAFFLLLLKLSTHFRSEKTLLLPFSTACLALALIYSKDLFAVPVLDRAKLSFVLPTLLKYATLSFIFFRSLSLLKLKSLEERKQGFLLLLITLCLLLSYPFSHIAYFIYIAPLALLAFASIFIRADVLQQRLVASLICVALLVQISPLNWPQRLWPSIRTPLLQKLQLNTSTLAAPHGHLRVLKSDTEVYNQLTERVHALGREKKVYAFPDSPEVYFLLGKESSERTFFQFLEQEHSSYPVSYKDIKQKGADIIVINNKTQFTPEVPQKLKERIQKDYPHTKLLSSHTKSFEFRWR